ALLNIANMDTHYYAEHNLTVAQHPSENDLRLMAELIREKIFRLTGQEIPYSVAVTVDQFSENPKATLVTIHATIHVEKESQKGIIIGKSGVKLKRIGEEARAGIERLLNTKVFLKLFVRVEKNWSRDTKSLAKFGY
ncbi:MAG: YaeQ family protein, partial [Proteobacteria bacterium]|nr:YaeQ family protein [Pseudomonadota bacterium]